MITQRAYKFRIYPNAGQRKQLAKEFGCARWVWNHCLEWRVKASDGCLERHNYVSLNRHLTELKHSEFPWLADATASCLTQVLVDQDKAFDHFFRRVKAGEKPGFPNFKSRNSKPSIRYQLDQRQIDRAYRAGEFLRLPKLGAVKVRWSRLPVGTPKMVTVSRDAVGRYFVSFSCEEVIEALPMTGKAVGLDLGIKDVVVGSDGYKSGNPKHLKAKLRHLKRQQRRLARMKNGSHRRARQKVRVAKIHASIAATRSDFLHKTTTAVVCRNDIIALEDLNVRGMMQNHSLAGAIADVGMYEFRRRIEYKAKWYGRQVALADRWAPTSKTCSECGCVQDKMPLPIREWTCACGAHHDRDVNAARNILKFSTAGYAGIDARGVGTNLSATAGTHDETRTDAQRFTYADRTNRAA